MVPICLEDEDTDIFREDGTYLGDEALHEYRKAESEWCLKFLNKKKKLTFSKEILFQINILYTHFAT